MNTQDTFQPRLDRLKTELCEQAQRVLAQTQSAVECYFNHEPGRVESILAAESMIDRMDVEIERQSIPLLSMGETNEHAIRTVLTIVKVNNELERITDCAVNIAEASTSDSKVASDRFMVMANSVLGMLRDTNISLADGNHALARRVLEFDDTVDRFKREILLNAQRDLASHGANVEDTFALIAVTKSIERIADHCTNICEQVIYLETGKIVRHDAEGWSDPIEPES